MSQATPNLSFNTDRRVQRFARARQRLPSSVRPSVPMKHRLPMILREIVAVVGTMAWVAHAIAAMPPPQFKVVTLGTLPGDVISVARGVNLAQHAVGNSDNL